MPNIFSISMFLKFMETSNRAVLFVFSVILFLKIGFLYGLAYFIIVRGMQALANFLIMTFIVHRNDENVTFGAFLTKTSALMTVSEAIILVSAIYVVFPVNS